MSERKKGYGMIRPEDGKQFSSTYQPEPKWTEEAATDLGNRLLEWMYEVDEFGDDKGNIFFKDFLLFKERLAPATISYLQNKFTSFSKLMETAKEIQKMKLIKFGVGDRLNATMTKFTLNVNHGMVEKEVKEHKVEHVPPIFNVDDK